MSASEGGTEISIRPATTADVSDVLDLWSQAEAQPSATDDVAGVDALIARDGHALLIAEGPSGMVGTLIAAFDGWRGNLYRLAVHPAWRRRGVARRLVEEGERRLRERGARRITALVAHEQDGACEFWVAVGYERDPHTDRSVKSL